MLNSKLDKTKSLISHLGAHFLFLRLLLCRVARSLWPAAKAADCEFADAC